MRKQHAPKATLFLMELVIVLFFFSICAAICVNVFGSAQQMAVNSDALSRAAMEARSAASCYKAAEGDLQQTARLLDGVLADEHNVFVYYDESWQKRADSVENGYMMQLCQYDKAKVGEARIRILHVDSSEDEPPMVFSIAVKTHETLNTKDIVQEGTAYETE